MSQINKPQTSKSKMWYDEKGNAVPYTRTTKAERLMERNSFRLLTEAQKINSGLIALKDLTKKLSNDAYIAFMEEANNSSKPRKGNFTWFNFDRSIKIEVSISERIEFDDLHLAVCKDKLDEFLNINVESKDEFIKQLIMDAFATTKGNLDVKKLMGLLRYRSKIKASLFQEAMTALEDGIRRPDSKTYFRIWLKDSENKYQNIDLNFSNI